MNVILDQNGNLNLELNGTLKDPKLVASQAGL